MYIKILTLTLASDRPITGNATKLRGFFATKFNEYILLHHHINVDKFLYKYPLVQYKIINGTPMILGINEGVEVLKEIYDQYTEIKLGDSVYTIMERGITVKSEDFGLSEKFHSYEFLTPWFALNQQNYRKYYGSTRDEQRLLLQRTLIGNLLSISKTLDYTVPDEIKVDVEIRPKKSRLKNTTMVGFLGKFIVNFTLPDYIGLGKSVSRGFGTIWKVE